MVYTAGITGTRHFGKLGTTTIPVPDTLVSSVSHQYHLGKFGTISVPVPDTLVSPVRHH